MRLPPSFTLLSVAAAFALFAETTSTMPLTTTTTATSSAVANEPAADVVPPPFHLFGSDAEDTDFATVARSCGAIMKTAAAQQVRDEGSAAIVLHRSLQMDDVAAACSSEGDALTLCGNRTFATSEQDNACASCISSAQDSTAQGRVREANYTCQAYSALSCGAVRSCSCLAPCSAEFLAYQECVLVESYKQKGVDFPCDLTCTSGALATTSSSLVLTALIGAAAAYLASLA